MDEYNKLFHIYYIIKFYFYYSNNTLIFQIIEVEKDQLTP